MPRLDYDWGSYPMLLGLHGEVQQRNASLGNTNWDSTLRVLFPFLSINLNLYVALISEKASAKNNGGFFFFEHKRHGNWRFKLHVQNYLSYSVARVRPEIRYFLYPVCGELLSPVFWHYICLSGYLRPDIFLSGRYLAWYWVNLI